MSQFVGSHNKAFACQGVYAAYSRVKITGAGQVTICGAGDAAIGTLTEASFAAGDMRSVRLNTAQGTHKMVAAGVIAVGAAVYQAAAGQISTTVLGAQAGTALEPAAAAGDVIEVMVV